jgi:hypothetical protein
MTFGKGNLHAVNFSFTFIGCVVSGYKSFMPIITLNIAVF